MLQITSSQRSRGSVSDVEEQEPDSLPGSQTGSTSKAPPSKKTKKSALEVGEYLKEYLQRHDDEAQDVRAEVNILSLWKILEQPPLHAILIH